MITIRIVFYDKKTLFMKDDIKIEIPYDLVLAAAEADDDGELSSAIRENVQVDYFNCRPFEVTEKIKAYAIERHPALQEKFNQYEYDFIGRHGLGPEYD